MEEERLLRPEKLAEKSQAIRIRSQTNLLSFTTVGYVNTHMGKCRRLVLNKERGPFRGSRGWYVFSWRVPLEWMELGQTGMMIGWRLKRMIKIDSEAFIGSWRRS